MNIDLFDLFACYQNCNRFGLSVFGQGTFSLARFQSSIFDRHKSKHASRGELYSANV